MARRNQHTKSELREMILSATEKLLDEDGLQALSTRKISAKIGYTVGTLYLFFKNLDELVLHVNARTLEQIYQSLSIVTEDGIDPRTNLIAMGHAYVHFAMEYPQRWRLVFEFSLGEGEAIPTWFQEKIDQVFIMVEKNLVNFVGDVANKRQLTQALWSGVHGVCALAVSKKIDVSGIESVQQLTDNLISRYLDGCSVNKNKNSN